jgi:hypothetical protein
MSKATTLEGTTQQRHADGAQTLAGSTFDEIPPVRELDHRHGDGVDVFLLWDARTDEVSIALTDERCGESYAFVVDPSEALTAFHHPYVYAAHASFGNAHRADLETE